MSTFSDLIDLFDNKLFRIIFIILIIPVIILAVYWLTFFGLDRAQKTRLPNLQNQCSIQSKKINDKIQSKNNSVIYAFTSHYNDYLQRCFVLMHGEGISQMGTSDILLDAYTEEEIAACESHATAPDIDFCKFRGEKILYNIDNFKDFIKTYLENK